MVLGQDPVEKRRLAGAEIAVSTVTGIGFAASEADAVMVASQGLLKGRRVKAAGVASI